MTAVYIHIPFCKSRCKYCSFVSSVEADLRDDYINAVCGEIETSPGFSPSTLYIGGGTPSALGLNNLEKLFTVLNRHFGPLKNIPEVTCEVNPESASPEKLSLLKACGVNRISIGAQSLNDKILETLGRAHDKKTFLQAYDNIKKAGFTNINIDLIAGAPGQSLADFKTDIEEVVKLAPQHISVYGLQIEEGTKIFEEGYNPDQILMRKMLEHARAALQNAGYKHYEISNFAGPGFESAHNNNYWLGGEYRGYGCGAASYLKGRRFANTEELPLYVEKISAGFEETLTGKEKLGEKILIGLRRLDGIDFTPGIKENFNAEVDALIKKGLLEKRENKIRLTEEGIFLSNEVFESFVAPYET